MRVSIRVVRLAEAGSTADAEILLTQTFQHDAHATVDVQREADRWELRNGAWALVSARTISDAVSIDGNVITSDRPGQPLTAPQRAAVAAQLKKDAWAIDTAVPGGNQRDLEPLYAAIGPARVVGLGEATHGTSEFFSLKDRIFRFLVEKMGFTVFAMETPWQSGLVIDRYVTTSEGDPHAALAGTFAVWDNQEVLDLIEWMRAYNLTRGDRPELRFVGIDMQDDPRALREMILRFVKAVRPGDVDLTAQRLACLQTGKPASADCIAGIAAVEQTVAGDAQAMSPPRDEALQAEHAATIALQIAQMSATPDIHEQVNSRDRSMARNLQWFATTVFPRARIALWAHDGHVMTSSTYGMIPMGTYLRRHYGAGYYVIGFAFYRGTVSPNGIRAPVTVAPDPPQAVGSVLRTAGEPLFGLNLRPIPTQTALGTFLASEQPMRTLGAFSNASDLNPSQTYGYVNLKNSFDTLIFVETMHPAHSFQVGRAAAVRPVTVPSGAGGVSWPTKWFVAGSDPADYSVGGDAPGATYPAGLLWLSSVSSTGYGVTAGTIPVARYLGKRIELSGQLRVFDVDRGASAWLRVDEAGGKTAGLDTMQDRMLQGTSTWKSFDITLDVPQDARNIAFGLLMQGRGWLWATNLKVESLEQRPP